MEQLLELIKYRDAGMTTYTYFYIDVLGRIVSPYFDSEKESQKWLGDFLKGVPRFRQGTE